VAYMLGRRRTCGFDGYVRGGYRSENVVDSSYLLQFAVASSGSHFDEAGFVDFDYEASAT